VRTRHSGVDAVTTTTTQASAPGCPEAVPRGAGRAPQGDLTIAGVGPPWLAWRVTQLRLSGGLVRKKPATHGQLAYKGAGRKKMEAKPADEVGAHQVGGVDPSGSYDQHDPAL
jgi:hypothetical protein